MSEAPALRIVPGAPPPAPLSKTQKKKRRAQGKGEGHDQMDSPLLANGVHSAIESALVDSVPATKNLNTALVTKPEEVANAAIASGAASDIVQATGILPSPIKKTSAVVELVNKRHRALHKKIQRIKEYSHKPVESLNEDQKKSLATLPALEASSKEVEGVREAIELHEAEEHANEARRAAEIEAIVKQRIADAVADARATAVSRAVELVTLLRELPRLSSSSECQEFGSALQETDQSKLETTVGLFLAGQGDYSKVSAALNAHLHPPSPTGTPAPEEHPEPETTDPAPVPSTVIGGIPASAPVGGSYHFMQESELEPSTPFDEGAEWVEHPEEQAAQESSQAAAPVETQTAAALDWAAEDHGDLPPISGLQEHFGASGQATPVVDAPPTDLQASTAEWAAVPDEYGAKETKEDESDGFTTIPSKRGHGESRGGDRSRGRGYRGRGGAGGEWRSGYGSGGEGRGGYRSGGENRGRGGGEHRGRPRGEWRGGRGEYRGRGEGRGEGRGGYRGRPAPAPAAASDAQ